MQPIYHDAQFVLLHASTTINTADDTLLLGAVAGQGNAKAILLHYNDVVPVWCHRLPELSSPQQDCSERY